MKASKLKGDVSTAKRELVGVRQRRKKLSVSLGRRKKQLKADDTIVQLSSTNQQRSLEGGKRALQESGEQLA